MSRNFGLILAGALLTGVMLAAPAPAAAGDSFHLSLGIGALAVPYAPPVVVAPPPPAYYGGVVVVPAPRARWHHHHGYYAPPRHYVYSAPPGYRHDGRRGPDRRWR